VSNLAALTPKEISSILERIGFQFIRQKGSHRIYVKDKRQIVVPMHSRTLKRGTQMNIIKATGMEPEEFMKLR
jgi:predicted RNA binding protein YcfA (HicA-like mRNA interferase family)